MRPTPLQLLLLKSRTRATKAAEIAILYLVPSRSIRPHYIIASEDKFALLAVCFGQGYEVCD